MNQIQLNSIPPEPVSEQSDEELEALLARVSLIPANRKRRTWLVPTLTISGLILMTVICGVMGLIDNGWFFVIGIFTFPLITCVTLIAINRKERRDIEALAKYDDIRAVGGLLDGVNFGNRRLKRSVHRSLEQLLPKLAETDADLLSTGQREALNMLIYDKSPELAMAALQAIQRVGDGTALPYLTAMAVGKGILLPCKIEAVRCRSMPGRRRNEFRHASTFKIVRTSCSEPHSDRIRRRINWYVRHTIPLR